MRERARFFCSMADDKDNNVNGGNNPDPPEPTNDPSKDPNRTEPEERGSIKGDVKQCKEAGKAAEAEKALNQGADSGEDETTDLNLKKTSGHKPR